MRLYTQREVQKIFSDVPGKTLIYWGRIKLVEWTDEKRDARGIHREYSVWNLYQLAIVRELTRLGVKHHVIRMIMDSFFKDYIKEPPPPDVADSIKRGHRLKRPSKSGVMNKILVLDKFGIGPGGEEVVADGLENPSQMGNLLENHHYPPILVLITLSTIVEEIQDKVAGMKER